MAPKSTSKGKARRSGAPPLVDSKSIHAVASLHEATSFSADDPWLTETDLEAARHLIHHSESSGGGDYSACSTPRSVNTQRPLEEIEDDETGSWRRAKRDWISVLEACNYCCCSSRASFVFLNDRVDIHFGIT